MVDAVLFSSKDSKVRTPAYVFDPLRQAFDLRTDLAANEQDHLLPSWIGPGSVECADAFEWRRAPGDRLWCNPPWGRGVRPNLLNWTAMFRKRAQEGALVVALLPARTDVRWFHESVLDWADVLLIKGRVVFDKSDGSGPHDHGSTFPAMICIWEPDCTKSDRKTQSWVLQHPKTKGRKK